MSLFASFLALFAILAYVQACDKTSCTPTPAHYDELGCAPVLNEERCCPVRYECPERDEKANGCFHRGKLYKVGESIEEQFLPKRCDASCKCEYWEDESTYQFACEGFAEEEAAAYVAENKLVHLLDKHIDETNHIPLERCHGKAVTDSEELRLIKKTKCLFDGKVYTKGDRIVPDGTCHECICDERLKTQDLDIFTPQCQRKQCGIGSNGEEHDYLNRGCAPVYDQTKTTCCPVEWRCPAKDDVIRKGGVPPSTGTKMKCQFGGKWLNLFDSVQYEGGDKLNCKCYIPPMVHCLKSV